MSSEQQKIFSFASRWHLYRGVAYGLQHTCMAGQITVSRLSDWQLQHLDNFFGKYLKEDFPDLASGIDGVERFARRLFFWLGSIQRQSAIPVSEKYWIRARQGSDADSRVFDAVIPVIKTRPTLIAVAWLEEMVNAAFSAFAAKDPEVEDIHRSLDQVHKKLSKFAEPGVNNHLILQAANRLDIPATRLNRHIIVLGTGCYSRWVDSTVTDRTSALGIGIATNKQLTARLLRSMGLPGARQVKVSSPEQAIDAAASLGYPVVVKPADKERGVGVNADLRDEESVRSAFQEARAASAHILVEKFCAGFTHRLTVQQGQLIRVTKRVAGGVVGDGAHDVAELVALWQQDAENQRRSRRLGRTLLSLDTEAEGLLSQQGIDEKFVPQQGQYVRLRRRDNINAGGTNEYLDVAEVHPDNSRLAIDTARFFGLDFAGVDLIIDDIGKSWFATEALICEVNAKPQMGDGRNEKIYDQVLERLMGEKYRIPAHLIICSSAVEDHSELAERLSRGSGGNGVSTLQGLWIGGRRATGSFENGFDAARALLIRSEIVEAWCLMTPQEIVRAGLPNNRWVEARVVESRRLTADEQQLIKQITRIIAGHIEDNHSEGTLLPTPLKDSPEYD